MSTSKDKNTISIEHFFLQHDQKRGNNPLLKAEVSEDWIQQ